MARDRRRAGKLDRGWYVEPTIFADVDNGMRLAQDEVFGPVLAIIPHDGDDDAVRIATTRPTGCRARSSPPISTAR